MKATMPGTMGRILGGFRGALAETDRHPTCSLSDQPQVGPQLVGWCHCYACDASRCCLLHSPCSRPAATQPAAVPGQARRVGTWRPLLLLALSSSSKPAGCPYT